MSSDRGNAPFAAARVSVRQIDFPFGGIGKSKPEPPLSSSPPLTQRELDVLRLIAEGLSTKQIAARLGISFKTAACHRMHLMQKLGIHETASLVRWAVREKIVGA